MCDPLKKNNNKIRGTVQYMYVYNMHTTQVHLYHHLL